MTRQTERLRAATATILRILKVMEPSAASAHERFRSHPTDIAALHFIAENTGAPSKDLAAHLGVAPTTASGVVDRLVAAGLVERVRPEANRRVVALALSREGETVRADIIAEELETSERLLQALPRERRAAFIDDMSVIAADLVTERDS